MIFRKSRSSTRTTLHLSKLCQRSHGFVKAWDLIQLKRGRGCTISRMAERQLPGLGNLALCYKKKKKKALHNIPVFDDPPCSPNQLDFDCDLFLFTKVKSALKGTRFLTVQSSKEKVTKVMNRVMENDQNKYRARRNVRRSHVTGCTIFSFITFSMWVCQYQSGYF
ncbi:hypothetical protein J6590_082163 [Homalodisca vitripennis]|nr:hypothetical protein J6590_082163 [Homalodisca vitripennis]